MEAAKHGTFGVVAVGLMGTGRTGGHAWLPWRDFRCQAARMGRSELVAVLRY